METCNQLLKVWHKGMQMSVWKTLQRNQMHCRVTHKVTYIIAEPRPLLRPSARVTTVPPHEYPNVPLFESRSFRQLSLERWESLGCPTARTTAIPPTVPTVPALTDRPTDRPNSRRSFRSGSISAFAVLKAFWCFCVVGRRLSEIKWRGEKLLRFREVQFFYLCRRIFRASPFLGVRASRKIEIWMVRCWWFLLPAINNVDVCACMKNIIKDVLDC